MKSVEYCIVKIESIKLEIMDMNDAEPCTVKNEDIEEQRGGCQFLIYK